LNRLAQKMNPERDVLVLALSSDCSSAHRFYVSNGDMPISDLAGEDIRNALDNAGIRWRVIVVSGCHPGPFIDQLADDRTLVIGSSATYDESDDDKNSSRLTRFGEAFYRDALPQAASIREAYEAARKAIAASTSDAVHPSNLQAHFGREIEQKLAALDRTRIEQANSAPPPTAPGANAQ
jgi:hypothetical protein